VFWCIRDGKHRCTIFHALVDPVRISQKSQVDTLHQTCVFTFGGIYRARSVFWCIRAGKHRCTIFYARVDPVQISKRVSEHVTLNFCFFIRCDLQVAYYVLVRSGHETSTHYFSCSGGPGMNRTKSAPGPTMQKLCFYIRWDLRVMLCVMVCPGCETSTHYFSCSGGPGSDTTKLCWDTLCQSCAFASGSIYG
jgi:hypothetical protein